MAARNYYTLINVSCNIFANKIFSSKSTSLRQSDPKLKNPRISGSFILHPLRLQLSGNKFVLRSDALSDLPVLHHVVNYIYNFTFNYFWKGFYISSQTAKNHLPVTV